MGYLINLRDAVPNKEGHPCSLTTLKKNTRSQSLKQAAFSQFVTCFSLVIPRYPHNKRKERGRRERVLWSLPAGGAPPSAARICRSPENEMIVLLQREKKTCVTETY